MATMLALTTQPGCMSEPQVAADADIGIDVVTGHAEPLSAAGQCLLAAPTDSATHAGMDHQADAPDASILPKPLSAATMDAVQALVGIERSLRGLQIAHLPLRPPDDTLALPGV